MVKFKERWGFSNEQRYRKALWAFDRAELGDFIVLHRVGRLKMWTISAIIIGTASPIVAAVFYAAGDGVGAVLAIVCGALGSVMAWSISQ